MWNHDESRILTYSTDGTARIWSAETGKELERLEGFTGNPYTATWNQDGIKILTSSTDGTVSVWYVHYVHMEELIPTACLWTPRNFTWTEWNTYMEDNIDTYRPTCPNAPIPPDAIAGIQDEARQQIRVGQIVSATARLAELNGWLQVNGQFESFGVKDVDAFVAEVSATATAEALPSPTP